MPPDVMGTLQWLLLLRLWEPRSREKTLAKGEAITAHTAQVCPVCDVPLALPPRRRADGGKLRLILCPGKRCQCHHGRMGNDELQGFAEQALAWFLARPGRGSRGVWQGDEVKLMASIAATHTMPNVRF